MCKINHAMSVRFCWVLMYEHRNENLRVLEYFEKFHSHAIIYDEVMEVEASINMISHTALCLGWIGTISKKTSLRWLGDYSMGIDRIEKVCSKNLQKLLISSIIKFSPILMPIVSS